MATLSDVAKRAGVSTATVSKVLSNTPYFTEEIRLRVNEAIRELNYTPNLPARALASGKTEIIAVVFPVVFDSLFTDPYVLYLLQGIEAVCHEHGYNLLLSTPRLTTAGPDEQYLRLIHSRYLDGVVALDNVPGASVLEPVHKLSIPSVAIGYHPAQYFVRTDDYSGGVQALEHLVALGHRHIGIISVAPDLNFAVNERMRGIQAAAEALSGDECHLATVEGDFSTGSGASAAEQLLTQNSNLTAIICLNDRMAMGAIQFLRTTGKLVPENISVVGYDNLPSAASFAPPLTTIDNQAPTLGKAAAQMLFEIMSGKQPESKVLPTSLTVRGSTRSLK